MFNRNVQIRRWMVVLSVLGAMVFGAMAGSLSASRGGQRVPILMAAKAAPESAQVSFPAGFVPVVKRALPAVVNVSSSKVVRSPQGASSPFFSDPFFRNFFGDGSTRQFHTPREQREHSLGSGVLISPDGYILTNNHVVDGAHDVKVLLGDKREMKAKIVGTDAKTDIAILKIEGQNLPVLTLGDSSTMQPGAFVLAIGNPFGLNQTVTMGIVSAIGRGNLGIEDYEDFIQTDAAINPGNSGGALINERGELIGINTAILSGGSGGNQGVGFAIPINMARQVMDQILKHGKVIRGWLGVVIQPVTPEIAKAFGLPETRGALIGDVTAGAPAAKAGLEKGDVVLQLNSQPIESSRDLQLKVAMMAPGTKVTLHIFRNGARREVPVTLGQVPDKSGKAGTQSSGAASALDGVSVDELTPDVLQQLNLPATTKGVVVTDVGDGSAAAEVGLRSGDVIQQVNKKPVNTVAEFQAAIRLAGSRPVLLLVNRGGSTMFIVVEPG